MPSCGFSSRSAVETSSKVRVSVAQSGGGGGGFQTHGGRGRRAKSLCQGEMTDYGAPPPPEWPIPPPPGLRRTLSGTLAPQGPRAAYWPDEEMTPPHLTYRGPSHRTISRIANRQQHYGYDGWAARGDGWGGGQRAPQWHVHRPGQAAGYQSAVRHAASLQRAASLRSVRSVGKGLDVADGASVRSNDQLGG